MNQPTQEQLRQLGVAMQQCQNFVGKLISLIENGYIIVAQTPGHNGCPTCCSGPLVEPGQHHWSTENYPVLNKNLDDVISYLLVQEGKTEFRQLNPEVTELDVKIEHLQSDPNMCGCCQERTEADLEELYAKRRELEGDD